MEVTMRKLESAYRVPRSQLDSAMGVLDKYRLGKRQVRNRPLQIHVGSRLKYPYWLKAP